MVRDTPIDNQYDVIVIGGGASGMMAAIAAARRGAGVLLLEKNKRLGKKLSISGGGRCNITNAEDDMRMLLANYGSAAKFLYSAFARFGMQDTIDFFTDIGVPIKIEDRKRAFPKSDSAEDVVRALFNEMTANGVEIRTHQNVEAIVVNDRNEAEVFIDGMRITAAAVVLSTGGASHQETGSTGDGFAWLKKIGHTVKQPSPNITPIAVKDSWVQQAKGITIKDAKVHFNLNDKRNFSARGDILITHFGLSGPTILNNAYRVADLLNNGAVTATIDCFPNQSKEEIDAKLTTVLNDNGAKDLKNVLRLITPPGMTQIITDLAAKKIDVDLNNSEQSKESRLVVVELLKALPLTIDKLMGFKWAVVADGGVDLREIDTRTMHSRIINNLYVTGDLLDINRPSGGYSLQLCWTSGYIAGLNAASEKKTPSLQ